MKAAPQSLLEIKAENPLRLMRVAWHIGNRHTPAEITSDAIYIENDHVLAEMVRGQGCAMSSVMRPSSPSAAPTTTTMPIAIIRAMRMATATVMTTTTTVIMGTTMITMTMARMIMLTRPRRTLIPTPTRMRTPWRRLRLRA